jgi:hypothetical protein
VAMLDGVGRRLNEQGEEKGQKSMRATRWYSLRVPMFQVDFSLGLLKKKLSQ